MRRYKYLTKRKLMELNGIAIRRRANQSLDAWNVSRLPDVWFPVLKSFIHNDREVRCQIVINDRGERVWLDIPLSEFMKLPEVNLPISQPEGRK